MTILGNMEDFMLAKLFGPTLWFIRMVADWQKFPEVFVFMHFFKVKQNWRLHIEVGSFKKAT